MTTKVNDLVQTPRGRGVVRIAPIDGHTAPIYVSLLGGSPVLWGPFDESAVTRVPVSLVKPTHILEGFSTREEYEFYAEDEAVHRGIATGLARCGVCHFNAGGSAFEDNEGPLRGIVRTTVSRGFDPTEVLHLTCGHAVI